jgi:peptidoglycan lytic transglycosylase
VRGGAFNAFAAVAAPLMVGLVTVGLTACGSAPPRPASGPTAPAQSIEPPAPKRGGAYYLDDGPGDNPPPNLDSLPDAVPRVEPLRPAANRPYEVFGKTYTPLTTIKPYREKGVASWYGKRYHGKATSSGEIYDMYGMTAAHPTLPIPSYARITNLKTGRTVVVRVNDRGPFLHDRVIDLSYAAAYRIGTLAGGSGLVEVELMDPGRDAPGNTSPAPGERRAEQPRPVPLEEVSASQGIYLQLGAFGGKDNAQAFLARLNDQAGDASGALEVFFLNGLYRVQSGPYASDDAARAAAARLASRLGIRAIVTAR